MLGDRKEKSSKYRRENMSAKNPTWCFVVIQDERWEVHNSDMEKLSVRNPQMLTERTTEGLSGRNK